MSGYFTRKAYDTCAQRQDTKESTDPLGFNLDVNKYVHCGNICQPVGFNSKASRSSYAPVDLESSLRGLDRRASDCNSARYPHCVTSGCLLTGSPAIAPHITPYACERGHVGDRAVIRTNMKPYQSPGYKLPMSNCKPESTNGYYIRKNAQKKL